MLMLDGDTYLCAKFSIIVVSHLNKVGTSRLSAVPDDGARVDLLDTFNRLPTVRVEWIRNCAHVSWMTEHHGTSKLTRPDYAALAPSFIANKVGKNWPNAGACGDDNDLIKDLRHVKNTGDGDTSDPVVGLWGVNRVCGC